MMARMKIQGMLPFRTVLAGIMLINMAAAQNPSGITQKYCSNQNTGSGFSAGKYWNDRNPCYRESVGRR